MAQTDGHGGQQIESDQWANLVKYFIETTYIFWYTTQVFGHGWLCHPTSRWGRFSEIFNFLAITPKQKESPLILTS